MQSAPNNPSLLCLSTYETVLEFVIKWKNVRLFAFFLERKNEAK